MLAAGRGAEHFSPIRPPALVNPITVSEPVTDAAGNPVKDAQGNPKITSVRIDTQTIPLGPAASQIAIKQLGTNGGGFFNANSAHPFENPTPLSNFLEMLAILLIPAALCYTFGQMVGDTRQGWAVLAAMMVLFLPLLVSTPGPRAARNPAYPAIVAQASTTRRCAAVRRQHGGQGGALRHRRSALWAVATTAASNGSVNAMHDSFTPLGGLVPLWLIQLGEVIFGGVGSGLYGMLMFAIVAVFVAGLMVGRTPEYLGKKIEAYEMKMASLVILIPPFCALVGTAIAVSTAAGRAGIANPGAHGFTEILYAFSSAAGNNGSAFAGLSPTRPSTTPPSASPCGVALLVDRAGARDRRQPRGQEARARQRRHAADAHAALRRAAGRGGRDRRRADLLPGAGARPDRRRAAVPRH